MKRACFSKALSMLTPALAFIPLFIGVRLIFCAVYGWVDWSLALGCAALVAVNPIVVRAPSAKRRAVWFMVGFLSWVVLLVCCGFVIMAVVFHEGL